jgi:hypothetical protein
LVDELILLANIIAADPPRLPLPDHVHRLVSLNRSPGDLELAKALLGLHSSFDRSMILLQDVVQVLDRSMSAAAAQGSFLFHCCNRRAVEAGLISIDDAGLGVRWIAESLAEQACGRRSIAQRRQQEVDSGTGGIDGPIEVTPTALHSNIRLIDTPGFVGRLEMTAQPLFQFGTVTLNPTPDRRVIRLQTAFGEQLFDVAERERVAKIPAHGTQNQLRRRLPPLEDCRSGCVLHDLFRLPPAKVATHPPQRLQPRAKRALHEMMYAERRAECEAARSRFEAEYQAKYPKAVESLTANWERLVTFFDFPAEHWKHLRTTNVIESPFATVRLRERATRGAGSRTKGLLMAFKLLDMTQQRWRRLDGAHLLPLVRAGTNFIDGVQEDRAKNVTQSTENEPREAA